MKFKYYLRGLGIGIVVTALLAGIANGSGKKEMTTEQIIIRAQELGMVSEDDYNSVKKELSNAKSSITDLESQLQEAGEIDDSQAADENTPEEEQTQNEEPNEPVTTTTESDGVTTEETYTEGSENETTLKFSVIQGMSAEAVSKLLQEKGIIPDAGDFNNYIVETGNVNNIQVGEYEVKSGESYDTILGKLTGR
ncbi:hypothetical protein [Konateibacter massiliensis]|uniref:hypothetical protein n=1 Tax=Konateibacter massiliensis TaxID=2002841 RepID=UPI000C15277D|nr:hypothetical protein [Konateibacter massiliensis]